MAENQESNLDILINKVENLLEISEVVQARELIKLAGEASKMINFANKSVNFVSQKKFEMFLYGFKGKETTDEQIKKLEKYIDNKDRAEFISNSFTKVLLSNSSKACAIMGVILKEVIDKDDISYQDLICINALSSFYDYDIESFLIFKSFIEDQKSTNPKLKSIYHHRLRKYCIENQLDINNLLLTLEKGVTLQVLNKDYQADIQADIDIDTESLDINSSDIDESYKVNNTTRKLIEYINIVYN